MRGAFPAHRPSLAGRRTGLFFGRVAGAPAGPTNSLCDVNQISGSSLLPKGGSFVSAAAPLAGGAIRTVRRSHAPTSSVAPSPSSQPREPASRACRQPGRAQEDDGSLLLSTVEVKPSLGLGGKCDRAAATRRLSAMRLGGHVMERQETVPPLFFSLAHHPQKPLSGYWRCCVLDANGENTYMVAGREFDRLPS